MRVRFDEVPHAVDRLHLPAQPFERTRLEFIGECLRQRPSDVCGDGRENVRKPLSHVAGVGVLERGRDAQLRNGLREHRVGHDLAVRDDTVEIENQQAVHRAPLMRMVL